MWSLYAGSLPPGLTLSGATISGTPSSAGTYNFTIKVADSASHTATQGYTVTISGAALTLTTTASPSGWGTISPWCPGGCSYTAGSQLTVTATPNSGYAFSSFTGTYSGTANPFTINLTGTATIAANFVTGYTISGQVTLSGGSGVSGVSISASGSQNASATTDANGLYSLPALPAGGNYTVTASKSGYLLSAPRTFNNLAQNQSASGIPRGRRASPLSGSRWLGSRSAREETRFTLILHSSSNANTPGTRRPLSSLTVFAVVLSANHLLAANAAVTGTVADDSGRPVPGARILISYPPSVKVSVTAPPVITGPLAATVTADANGAFHADALAPGDYIACAETTSPGYLDPCHWATSAPSFTVTAGQTTSGINIVMAKGSVLRIHVDDPQQLLKPATGPIDLDFQIHVVTPKGLHYNAQLQSSTAVARDHAITIPFGTPVSLRVMAAHVTVNDQSGKSFAAQGATVSAEAGTTPPAITLTVTGKK